MNNSVFGAEQFKQFKLFYEVNNHTLAEWTDLGKVTQDTQAMIMLTLY